MICKSEMKTTRMRVFVRRVLDIIAGHAGVRWAAGSSTIEAALMLALKRLPPEGIRIHLPSSMKRSPDSATLYAMKAMEILLNRKAQSYQNRNKTFEVGIWHEISPAGSLRVVKQSFIVHAFGVMVRSRGVPRRGGRSGICTTLDSEEVNSFAPREAMANSSTSSEQEFLLLPDSYQPIRLRIPGRLLRSDVILNLSIYLSEAAPEDNPSSSQAPAEVQSSEMFLGDMNGRVYHMPHPLTTVAPAGQPPQGSVPSEPEILPPVHEIQNNEECHSAIHPGPDEQLQWDVEMATWLDTSSLEQTKPPELPSHPS